MSLGSRVLYEDEHCLAIAKRAGQFVQGDWAPPGEMTLEQEVRAYLQPDHPASAYLGIVHRLDRPVSGVLIWAKTSKGARRLSAQFERRQVEKEYWAVVETNIPVPEIMGAWTDWLTLADADGVVAAVPPGTKGSRLATTRFRLDDATCLPARCAWLILHPESGRTHQLRIQCARRGWPILGDQAYGSTRPFEPGIALHAYSIKLRHPITHAPLSLSVEPSKAWAEAGIRLR